MVHILFALIMIGILIFTQSYKIWREHLSTIWYVSSMVLLYHFLTPTKKLWIYSDTLFPNVLVTELIYIFIAMPCAVLIFLNCINKAKNFKCKVICFFNTVLMAILWESIYITFTFIYHLNGWNLYFSALFYIIMFLCICLHETKPFLVYLFSIIAIFILMIYFRIPFLNITFNFMGG